MTEEQEERLRAEFNRWAAEGRGVDPRHPGIVEKLFGRMQVGSHERSLDVGCGSGWATRRLAQSAPGGLAVGIDVSDEMVALARRRSIQIENVMFALGSADEIPWQEGFFSLVLSFDSAFYWPDPERAAREIRRVAAPRGRLFVVNTFYRENPLHERWQSVFGVPVHLKGAAEWEDVFRVAGFDAVESLRLTDETPVEPDFQPTPFYRAPEEKVEFRRAGALLIQAVKPDASMQ